jgi:limonene-1,2-epoxide hydrolase
VQQQLTPVRADQSRERVVVHRPILARPFRSARRWCLNRRPAFDERDHHMNETTPAALRVALAYYEAWTGKDMDKAMTYVAQDVVCEAPAGRIEGAAAYRAFLGPFAGTLTDSAMIAAYGDERQALIMYDTSSPLVASAPGAECLTVVDGRITYSRFLFDRLPFQQARR